MPNKAFLNLEDKKKEKLEKAALVEFSKYTYDQISINRIILSIDMPRGSFYLYFKDKEDLYLYIFSKYHNILLDFIIDDIKKNDDDIIKTFQNIFDNITAYTNDGDHKELIKNFFIGLNHNIENKIFKPDDSINTIFVLFKDKYEAKFKNIDLQDIFDILMNVLIHSLTSYYIFNLDIDNVRNRFINKLEIIKKGIY